MLEILELRPLNNEIHTTVGKSTVCLMSFTTGRTRFKSRDGAHVAGSSGSGQGDERHTRLSLLYVLQFALLSHLDRNTNMTMTLPHPNSLLISTCLKAEDKNLKVTKWSLGKIPNKMLKSLLCSKWFSNKHDGSGITWSQLFPGITQMGRNGIMSTISHTQKICKAQASS